jgi:hypothetical protein
VCDSCGCKLPNVTHGDTRNILHRDWVKGKVSDKDLRQATLTPQGPDTIAQVKRNISSTEKLITTGKLDPTKKA